MYQETIEATAQELWNEVDAAVAPYPDNVVAVPKPIIGTAFFPGGFGLWMQATRFPVNFPAGQIMILGQDFNSVAAYSRAFARESEVGSSPTWRNLRQVLANANILLDRCFFTNVYMGLRIAGRETGRFPGIHDEPFVRRCLGFLVRQIAIVRPRMILTLGLEPLRAVGPLFSLAVPQTLAACNHIYRSLRLAHGEATLVPLTHPSLYHANVHRRRYGGLIGADAEQAMLRAGSAIAFPPATMS